jgi:hypothetical protein
MKKLLPFIFLIFFSSLLTSNGEGVKIVFRYDDYLLIPSQLSDSLLSTFSRHKIPLCIGIIPFDASGKFLNRFDSLQISGLRDRIKKGEVEVALHGFNHQNQLKPGHFSKSTFSEFATVPYRDQLNKLSTGKHFLDSLLGSDIKVFVPPFNTYDDNTLKVLESLGFEVISGSRQGSSNGEIIKFIPATHEDFAGLTAIIEKNRGKDVSIIVYFHPYTFKGDSAGTASGLSGKITMKELDSILSRLNKTDVSFYSFRGLSGNGSYGSTSFRNNSMKYNLTEKTLNYVKLYSYGTISSSGSDSTSILLKVINILLHILVFVLVFFLAGFLLKILNPGIKPVLVFLLVCLIPIAVFLVYIRNDFSFGMIVIMLLVIFSALIVSILNKLNLLQVRNPVRRNK